MTDEALAAAVTDERKKKAMKKEQKAKGKAKKWVCNTVADIDAAEQRDCNPANSKVICMRDIEGRKLLC